MQKKTFGFGSQQNLNGGKGFNRDLADSSKLEDSVAAMDRQPRRVDGLTTFLRKEYYRLHGIYINRARDEQKKLFEFWRN